jgi:hydroxycarboxylate dehydrogenase B
MWKFEADILRGFAVDVFCACGTPAGEAQIVAEHLVTANLLGYDTHGVIRIPQYIEDIRKGVIRPGAPVLVGLETETTAVVDGGWNFGQVGGMRAIDIGIAKARAHHTATVVVKRCNHAGRLGTFTHWAAEQNLLAIGVCNSPRHGHFVLPWGGLDGRLATNPFSFAAPCGSAWPIVADFSTAETSEGAVRLHRNLRRPLPAGTIVDSQGTPTTDPSMFYGPPRGAILPFGGEKGYRGYALSLLVEIFGGIMGGSSTIIDQPGNGLAFVLVDIEAFLPMEVFARLMEELREYLKSSRSARGKREVMLPGEPDFRKREDRLHSGIPIDEETWAQILAGASSVGVESPRAVRMT